MIRPLKVATGVVCAYEAPTLLVRRWPLPPVCAIAKKYPILIPVVVIGLAVHMVAYWRGVTT